ncbi:spermidine synthase [Gilvimarinus sp. F26214L]|uniref:spermidine synthase n=1 Tax=Gilvimarinus sp. DZF01 TaxID=3461371 RepID=UPI004046013B
MKNTRCPATKVRCSDPRWRGRALMALVWQKRAAGRVYEVRRAGRSLRLYTNGTFHSQYHPDRLLDGSIWDLLVLPALLQPHCIQRVLVLGVGGGAVIRRLERFLGPVEFCGVELDPVHLTVARRHFGLRDREHVTLVEADAVAWLSRYRGKPFDLIVDDLFVENGGDPTRAVNVGKAWADALCKHLSPQGLLVLNFESAMALRRCALNERLRSGWFQSAYSLSVPGYDNRIGAFFRSAVSRADLSSSLREAESRLGRNATRGLRARLRKIRT